MATTRIVGIDGNWTAVTGHAGVINQWAATGSQFIYNTPGFGDSFMSRRGGLKDLVGSAGGWMISGTNPADPGITGMSNTGTSMVLTANTGCTITLTGVMASVALLSDLQSNANNLVFNWANGGTSVTTAWVTS